MSERENRRSILPPEGRGSSSLSPSGSPVEVPVHTERRGITRRGVILSLGGMAATGILGVRGGRGIEERRHSDSTLLAQIAEKDAGIKELQAQIAKISGDNGAKTGDNLRLKTNLAGCEASKVTDKVKAGAQNSAEEVKHQAELLGEKAKGLAYLVLFRASVNLSEVSLDSNKDAAILGLCELVKAAASLIENEGKKLEGFVEGVDLIFKTTKKLFVWYKESLAISDHLAELIDEGLSFVSGAVSWVDTVTAKALGNKVGDSIDWLLDQLGEKYPKIREIRETIVRATDFVEKRLPEQIDARRKQRTMAKDEWWRAQDEWIADKPGWPLKPVLEVIDKIAAWEKDQAEKIKDFAAKNEALVDERKVLRAKRLGLLKDQTYQKTLEQVKAAIAGAKDGQISDSELNELAGKLLTTEPVEK